MAAAVDGTWYLSFDCALKSFAWCLVRMAGPSTNARVRELVAEFKALALSVADSPDICEAHRRLAAAQCSADAASELSRELVSVHAGAAVDLIPGRKDNNVHRVERVRIVKRYVDGVIIPAIDAARASGCPPASDPLLRVAVEYQMSANFKANVISTTLFALFSDASVFPVGPSLKNTLCPGGRPELRHSTFTERYRSVYDANKAHAKALLDHFEATFGPLRQPVDVPRKLRKDFADSLIQAIAFHGTGVSPEQAAEKF
jgi:hypothetical protein